MTEAYDVIVIVNMATLDVFRITGVLNKFNLYHANVEHMASS